MIFNQGYETSRIVKYGTEVTLAVSSIAANFGETKLKRASIAVKPS